MCDQKRKWWDGGGGGGGGLDGQGGDWQGGTGLVERGRMGLVGGVNAGSVLGWGWGVGIDRVVLELLDNWEC